MVIALYPAAWLPHIDTCGWIKPKFCKLKSLTYCLSLFMWELPINNTLAIVYIIHFRHSSLTYRHGMCFRMSCVFASSILFWFPQRTHYFWRVFRFLFMERTQDYNVASLKTRCKFLFSLFQSHVTCRWIKTIWVNDFCAAAIAYLFHNLLIRWEINLFTLNHI
jgi:hypothetical protein